MQSQIQIAGIGEILMDVFEDGAATIGGAPFNVSFHANQLLGSSGHASMVSAVGDDHWGHHILDSLKSSGVSTEYLTVDNIHPTGVANVFVSKANAGFEIAPNAAWDYLTPSPQTDALAAQLNAVAFGSLAQRRAESGAMIRSFVAQVRGHRLYDINLRRNTTDGVRGYSTEIINESCRIATILKLNDGELTELCDEFGFSTGGQQPFDAYGSQAQILDRHWQQMAQLRDHFHLHTVVLTRAASGALLLAENETVQLPDSNLPQDQIHPVGAGDAFSAGLLYGLTRNLPLALSAKIADKLASWVTGFDSATPTLTPQIRQALQDIESAPAD